jgi:hypothetical protein
MLAPAAWAVAGAGLVVIYVSRFAILKLLRQPDAAILVWVAPRGLITVLLFLSAAEGGRLDGFPFGAVMLVVLITATLTAFSHREPVVADAVAIEVPPVTAANPVAEPVRPKA